MNTEMSVFLSDLDKVPMLDGKNNESILEGPFPSTSFTHAVGGSPEIYIVALQEILYRDSLSSFAFE